jgi:hypothetical protein
MISLVTFLLTFAVVLIAIAAMAIGVIRGRSPIRGSCGGLNGGPCALCGGNCDEETDE